jgi:hypothetical protein
MRRLIKSLCVAFIFCIFLHTNVFGNENGDTNNKDIFIVTAEEAGFYHISVTYSAVLGGGEILREIHVNGQVASGAEVVPFKRFFIDENTDWHNNLTGNQLYPPQVEVERSTSLTLVSRPGAPIAFWLEAGENIIEFVQLEGQIIITEPLVITPAAGRLTYAEYRQNYTHVPRASSEMIVIEAQQAAFKTSRSLYPRNDRTCPLVTPYHHTFITLNAIGGLSWRVPGQLIEWHVYVPAEGMYRIAIRYAQRDKRGFSSRI